VPFYFGGTSLLIVVSVTMDTVAQIHSHLLAHQYVIIPGDLQSLDLTIGISVHFQSLFLNVTHGDCSSSGGSPAPREVSGAS
jgi:hypothetical protein